MKAAATDFFAAAFIVEACNLPDKERPRSFERPSAFKFFNGS